MGRRKKYAEAPVEMGEDGLPVAPVKKARASSRALEKMRKVNALSSACNNEELVEVFMALPEGEFLLEVFAEAVDEKLQELYSGEQGEELETLSQAVDTLYQKVVAMNASPLMATLNMLSSKLGGSLPQQQYGAPPASPQAREAQELAQLHMQGSAASRPSQSNPVRDQIQVESSVPSW